MAYFGETSDTRIQIEGMQDSRSSFHLSAAGSFQSRVSLRRKLSLAQSFCQRVVTETPYLDPRDSESSWGPSVGQRREDEMSTESHMAIQDLEEPVLKPVPIPEIRKYSLKNVRAKLGTFKLWWFDLKTWYRRWNHKNWENPFLKDYIQHIERNFGSGIGALFSFGRWVIMLNIFLVLIWFGFVVIPMAVNFDYSEVKEPFAYRNLLDGKGPVAKSWVFYCAYRPWIKATGGIFPDFYYHTGLAYLIIILITFFGSLFIILRNMAIAQRPSSSASLNKRYCFAFLLWTSWDFSITSKDAANNLRKGIASALKDNMYQAKAEQISTEMRRKEKCFLLLRRVAAWIITLILVGGGCAAITFLVYYVNFTPSDLLSNDISVQSITVTADADFLHVYVTPIAFSFINILVPLFITKIPSMEQYKSGQTELNITIARIFLLRMANLFALIMSLYSMTVESSTRLAGSGVCTGTIIGQEIYKLIIMDTLIHTSVKLILSFGMYFWKQDKSEFDIPSAILTLIYKQALIWIGTVACPVLPIVGVFSNLVFFFLTYGIVKHTCKPPIKRWRQTRRTFFFMSVLLLTLLCVIVPVSIIIGSTAVNLGKTHNPLVSQGPFGSDVLPTSMYKVFVNSLPIKSLRLFLLWLISNTVVLPVFLILISILSYQKMRISGEENHCLILNAELQQEREDNKKLLNKLQQPNSQ